MRRKMLIGEIYWNLAFRVSHIFLAVFLSRVGGCLQATKFLISPSAFFNAAWYSFNLVVRVVQKVCDVIFDGQKPIFSAIFLTPSLVGNSFLVITQLQFCCYNLLKMYKHHIEQFSKSLRIMQFAFFCSSCRSDMVRFLGGIFSTFQVF